MGLPTGLPAAGVQSSSWPWRVPEVTDRRAGVRGSASGAGCESPPICPTGRAAREGTPLEKAPPSSKQHSSEGHRSSRRHRLGWFTTGRPSRPGRTAAHSAPRRAGSGAERLVPPPPPCRRRPRIDALVTATTPNTLVSNVRRNTSTSMMTSAVSSEMPASSTRTSKVGTTAAAASTRATSVTSSVSTAPPAAAAGGRGTNHWVARPRAVGVSARSHGARVLPSPNIDGVSPRHAL